MSVLEAGLARAAGAARERVAAARAQAAGAAASAAALDAKLARRHADLQRAEKRLHTVQKIKYFSRLIIRKRENQSRGDRTCFE